MSIIDTARYRPAPAQPLGIPTTRNDHVTVYLVICHPGKTHIHRSRGDTSWSAQTLPHETLPRNGRVTRSFYCDTSHFTGKVFFRHRGHRTGVHPPRNLNLGQNTPTTRFPRNPERATSMSIPVCGVCCIAGYELRNSFGRSKWFRDSAGGCRLGKQPKRSAAELDQRRRRAAAPPPPCGCAGPSPGARARKRVVGFCAVLVAGCSLVVPVRVPVGVRGFWVTCEGPLSAPDAHAPAGGAHNGHQ